MSVQAQTIPGMLAERAGRSADSLAVEDGSVRLSYGDLQEAARQAAKALLAAGVGRGERVAIWAPNIWEWIVAGLGIHLAGAVLVPINTRYKGDEAAFILAKSRARLLLTVQGFLGTDYPAMLARTATTLPCLEAVVVLRGPSSEGARTWSDFLSSGAEIRDAQLDDRIAAIAPEDPCDILFTSGTTGHPKGVVCSHGQTLRVFEAWSEVVGLRSEDRYLVVAPFFHCFGYKAGWLSCLMMGATVLPQAVFDASAVLARLAPDRVSVLPGPPALYQSLLASPDLAEHDLSSLRLAVTGAAVIPVELIRRMGSELGFDCVITGYGLTESCGVVSMCRYDDDPETIARTSGRAIPDVELRVVDDEGRELPRGEPGELVVRGYNVMESYFEEPEETAKVLDGEGWLYTGDIGVMDSRGYVRITDRKKDMFIVGGFNAYPAEIENTIMTHSEVSVAAVVGVPDDRLGEVSVAFVVRSADAALNQEGLVGWCRERMANYKVPRQVHFVDELPRNATGKVLKYVLRQRATGPVS